MCDCLSSRVHSHDTVLCLSSSLQKSFKCYTLRVLDQIWFKVLQLKKGTLSNLLHFSKCKCEVVCSEIESESCQAFVVVKYLRSKYQLVLCRWNDESFSRYVNLCSLMADLKWQNLLTLWKLWNVIKVGLYKTYNICFFEMNRSWILH